MEESLLGRTKITPPIQGKKERNSSIELFRILSTFLVLIVHFNGWFVGGMPEAFDFDNVSLFRTCQVLIESLSVPCVNCFLLISGYCGINLTFKKVYRYVTVLLTIYVPMYLFEVLLQGNFQLKYLIVNMLPVSRGGYFVGCYFLLMLLSPILNSFKFKEKKSLPLLLVLIGAEFYFDCLRSIEEMGFSQGYSTLHFCIMYLVGRSIYAYKGRLERIHFSTWISLYFLCTLLISLTYIIGFNFAYYYSNIFVILSSVCCFIPFIHFDFINKRINWIAQSTFPIYIIQVINPMNRYLIAIDNHLLTSFPYIVYIALSVVVIVSFFIMCILFDKLRSAMFDPLFSLVLKKIYKE